MTPPAPQPSTTPAPAPDSPPSRSAAGAAGGFEAVGADAAARSPHHELLLEAIRGRRLLQFVYAEHVRVFEPHAYGVSPTGEAILHGYQISGSSGSRPVPGWRTFTVAAMSEVVLTARRFSRTRADYDQQRIAFDPLWAEVEATPPRSAPGTPAP